MLKLAPKIGKRQMTEGPTVPRPRGPESGVLMVQVQWSTSPTDTVLSAQKKQASPRKRIV